MTNPNWIALAEEAENAPEAQQGIKIVRAADALKSVGAINVETFVTIQRWVGEGAHESAALLTVPEGYKWGRDIEAGYFIIAEKAWAEGSSGPRAYTSDAVTPALAIVAASCRARATDTSGDTHD